MKKGSLYHLRVRRKTAGNQVNAETYYVDDVLEKDVTDRRLDPILSFLDSFEEEEKEMTSDEFNDFVDTLKRK